MPELLLELLSEEIPARMQARAAEDLKRLVTERLSGAGPSERHRYSSGAAPIRSGRPLFHVPSETMGSLANADDVLGSWALVVLDSIERRNAERCVPLRFE